MQFKLNVYSLDSLKLDYDQNVYLNRTKEEIETLGFRHIEGSSIILRPDESFLVGYMKRARDGRVSSPTYNLNKDRPLRFFFLDKESNLLHEKNFELKDADVLVADVDGRHLSNLKPFPFQNKPLIAISDNNYIYTAWSEDVLIKVYNSDGEYTRSLYFPLVKKKISRDEILKRYDYGRDDTQKLLLHAEFPETWPALDKLIVDDENRLWVSTNVSGVDARKEWWVLQDTGELITKFHWPENRAIKKIKNGFLYVLETDEYSKRQTIERYRIKLITTD